MSTATKKRPTREGGWLHENVIRAGIPEVWAAERNGDHLSVRITFKSGGFIVTRQVRRHGGDTTVRQSEPMQIEQARGAFTAATRSLVKGIYPTN